MNEILPDETGYPYLAEFLRSGGRLEIGEIFERRSFARLHIGNSAICNLQFAVYNLPLPFVSPLQGSGLLGNIQPRPHGLGYGCTGPPGQTSVTPTEHLNNQITPLHSSPPAPQGSIWRSFLACRAR